ncbi:MAG: hypothetical protein IH600_13640 [Bacteroidetes bacterium]|nr:hypothetical protein [Bacteroidota bacterium]
MLGQLDPYAELIEEKENSEVDVLARGSYSGLGIKVRKQNGQHIVSYIYDEVRPLTNLRLGDVLLRIDDIDLRKENPDDLRPLLRGQPGTGVQLLVRRPGLYDSLLLTVLRREISIDPLPYQNVLGKKIFYMKLTRFTRTAIDSIQVALQRAYRNGAVRGVIIDVRDNPGGLLETAVALVDQFVTPGTAIVAMKGRQADYARSYFGKTEPIDAEVPIVVLVNEHSASASEIVAGALQDLDRAVIIGQRTFGKGLVQTLIPLTYNAFLKLTTSRYFIPSGRCIQRLSYENGQARNVREEATDAPVFHTLRLSRPVHESNGIIPDILLPKDSLSPLLTTLDKHNAIFSFVARYVNIYKPGRVPAIDRRLRNLFMKYADSLAIADGNDLDDALKNLKSEALRQGMQSRGLDRIRALDSEVSALRAAQFDRQWDEIKRLLTEEFVFQLEGETARINTSVEGDQTISRAVKLLEDRKSWEAALLRGNKE